MLNRWDIINAFIEKHNYKSYLEIGYYKGWSFDQVKCEHKVATDPNPCKTPEQEMTPYGNHAVNKWGAQNEQVVKLRSDEFFEKISDSHLWDIVFIDGLHEAKQVEKDIMNSLNHLSPGGTIVLHDCNPPKYEHTTAGIDGCWTGDTYKAFVKFRLQYPEYESFTVDTDWGCGIILTPPYPGTYIDLPTKYVEEQVEWSHFDKRREDLLNLISIEEFKTKMNEGA